MSLHGDVDAAVSFAIHKFCSGDLLVAVSPTMVAQVAMDSLKGDADVPLCVEWAAIEQLKQMARKRLAKRYDADSEENVSMQGGLFSGELQERYPVPRPAGAEPLYKPLEMLTKDEWQWNCRQLGKTASALLRHQDALQAYGDSKFMS